MTDTASPRYTLYGMWPSGPCYKVALALRLMRQPFDYEHVDLSAGAHQQPLYLARNRFGKVPALEDREAGLTLAESNVMLDYLSGRHDQFRGSSEAAYWQARAQLDWMPMGVASGVYRLRAARLGFRQISDAALEEAQAMAAGGLRQMDDALTAREWLAGESCSIADIGLYAVTTYCEQAGISLDGHSALTAWMVRMEALPGFAGPMDALPQESARIG